MFTTTGPLCRPHGELSTRAPGTAVTQSVHTISAIHTTQVAVVSINDTDKANVLFLAVSLMLIVALSVGKCPTDGANWPRKRSARQRLQSRVANRLRAFTRAIYRPIIARQI